MEQNITHDPNRMRFETMVDGYTGCVSYKLTGDKFNITHTGIPRPIEGQGIAADLVKYAYDYALENGLKPRATCPYAVVWLKRHPEYTK